MNFRPGDRIMSNASGRVFIFLAYGYRGGELFNMRVRKDDGEEFNTHLDYILFSRSNTSKPHRLTKIFQ